MAHPSENPPITLPEWNGPAILLVDLDAFFASVEQLDHPGWRGKPVIVGGDPDKRGVVSTASYEARRFGVHSAMPSSTARDRCPEAIWTSGHFDRYREMSKRVMDILFRETPFVQQVSIDEAFMDVSPTAHNHEHPVLIASRIQKRVKELGVTCSIGIGTTKSVAKVASDRDKPSGMTIVYPGRERAFLDPLPLSVMSGIGPVAQKRLQSFGMRTLGDVADADLSILAQVFGKNAEMMRDRCRGADDDRVHDNEAAKSISAEMSFDSDVDDLRTIQGAIGTMAAKACRRMRRKGLKGSTVHLKVRYRELNVRTAQKRLAEPTDDEFVVTDELSQLIDGLWHPGMPLRLVGVGISGFDHTAPIQGTLFDLMGKKQDDDTQKKASSLQDEEKRRGLITATDRIRDRFGESAVRFGREEHSLSHTTGSAAKNPEDYR
ncbi:MAG: DNA polymerase IV [Eggerthellaceae bacterium]|jgi:DNA polymerase-4